MSMLFITHDLGIVRKIADRVCVMTEGQDRRDRPDGGDLRQSAARLHPHLLAAEPKGQPPAADASARTVMTGEDIKVWFPIKQGFFRKTVDHVKAVDGIDVDGARRPDAGRRRRIRLGQDHARPGACRA